MTAQKQLILMAAYDSQVEHDAIPHQELRAAQMFASLTSKCGHIPAHHIFTSAASNRVVARIFQLCTQSLVHQVVLVPCPELSVPDTAGIECVLPQLDQQRNPQVNDAAIIATNVRDIRSYLQRKQHDVSDVKVGSIAVLTQNSDNWETLRFGLNPHYAGRLSVYQAV